MTCQHCGHETPGKRRTCPEICRSRQRHGQPVRRCLCGRLMGPRSTQCPSCSRSAGYQRRKARKKAGLWVPQPSTRPKEAPETTERIERLLRAVEASKRRARWAA